MDFIKYFPIFAFILNSLSYICCEYELKKVILILKVQWRRL